jgi:hypothetical protein
MASPAKAITQGLRTGAGILIAGRAQHQGDHAHRLLTVGGTVRQRDHRRRDGLRLPKPAGGRFLVRIVQPLEEQEGG